MAAEQVQRAIGAANANKKRSGARSPSARRSKKKPSKGRRAQPRRPSPAGRLEAILRRQGFLLVAGVDEVGRGALAGPLVTSAVLLDVDRVPEGLCDSKVLTATEREACAADVLRLAVAVSYVLVDPQDIDDDGLGVSNLAALRRAVRALSPTPDYVISDHFPLDEQDAPLGTRSYHGPPHVGLPKADAMSAAVAAASIVAKVNRDAHMCLLDADHPGYNFASNKGYGTDEHWSAIRALGPSPIHRRSFRGVASYQPTFADL